jgi:hypothetical protein
MLHKTSFVFGKNSNSAVLTSKVYSLLLGFDESCLLHLVSNGGWLRAAASALQSMSSSKSCLHLLKTLNHRAKQRCTCFPRFLRVSELSILSALLATEILQRCGRQTKTHSFNSQLIFHPLQTTHWNVYSFISPTDLLAHESVEDLLPFPTTDPTTTSKINPLSNTYLISKTQFNTHF